MLLSLRRYAMSQRADCFRANEDERTSKKQKVFNQGAAVGYEDVARHIDELISGNLSEAFVRKSTRVQP
jgi:hypothetical protein